MLQLPVLQIPLVLASQSPRRRQLLADSGFGIRVVKPDHDERFDPQTPVFEVAEYLATCKAESLRDKILPQEVLLTADTIVITGGEILGKPGNADEAGEMLRRLSGKGHAVVTGVCLKGRGRQISFSDKATVYFAALSDAEIDYYIERYEPFDKAGAYGIQEWIGHCRIDRIEGSYCTIMGLPTHLVYQHLGHFVGSEG